MNLRPIVRKLSLVAFLLSHPSLGAAVLVAQPEVDHPYFSQCDEIAYDASGEDFVRVDGQLLPIEFVLRSFEFGNAMEGPLIWNGFSMPEIRFVLVPACVVKHEGIELSASRPFYVATTALSVKQVELIHEIAGRESFYEARREVAADADQESVTDEILSLLRDPDNPEVHASFEDAALICQTLTSLSGTVVRLPTLAEWLGSMKAGADTKFWWGDDMSDAPDELSLGLPFPTLVASVDEMDEWSLRGWRLLSPVTGGPAHPLGLHHILGNYSEFVMPTAEERGVLRDQFGVRAPSRPEDDTEPSYRRWNSWQLAIQSHSFFMLGYGDVSNQYDLDKVLSWLEIVRAQSVRFTPSSGLDTTGSIRLVIEVPDGEVEGNGRFAAN